MPSAPGGQIAGQLSGEPRPCSLGGTCRLGTQQNKGRLCVGSRRQIPGQWRGNPPARLPSNPHPVDLRELRPNCCGYDNMVTLRICRKRAQVPTLTPHSPQQSDKSSPT